LFNATNTLFLYGVMQDQFPYQEHLWIAASDVLQSRHTLSFPPQSRAHHWKNILTTEAASTE